MLTFAGSRGACGRLVEVYHGNGYLRRHAHNRTLEVHSGQHVKAGETIAQARSTGRATRSQVHSRVWRDGRVLNPVAFVRNQR